MNISKILIIDDDPQIGELLQAYLQQQGFTVITRLDGTDLLDIIKTEAIDLLVLDVMLPNEDGLSLCQRVRRESDVMIIMLSALGEDTDRIVGLEVGADDYLPKPFNPRELLARIKSLIRRTQGELGQQRQQRQTAKVSNIHFAQWVIDRNKRQLLSPQAVVIPLTTGEYNLLVLLAENAPRILSRDYLLSVTHNREAGPFDRTIDVQIMRLRKKIETDPKQPQFIKTIRGGGYQFTAEITYG